MMQRRAIREPVWAQVCGAVVSAIDALCRATGAVVALAALGTVILSFASVFLRYVMGVGLMWLQEIFIWTHVAVIVLGAGYTMMTGGFVRVDIFYARWSDRRKALSDLVMTVVLLWPFLWIFGRATWGFWLISYLSDEASLNPRGMQDLWLLKGTMLGFLLLVWLQSVAFILRGVLVLGGFERYALRHAGHAAE